MQRFWELDFLRGLAVIMMITFHFIFDLSFFGIAGIDLSGPLLLTFQRAIAGIFILLVGICMTISYSRTPEELQARKYLWRSIKIFGLGMLITAMTFVFVPAGTIWFGILHFIGISIILSYIL
ncbi:MAG: heparan-alpha-glucosaminide N-acetyltransferase, partial [Candidatus Aenigmatarchaeota archaeon]